MSICFCQHLVSIGQIQRAVEPVRAHTSGAVTVVEHAHAGLTLVSNCDVMYCNKCSVLVGVCISAAQD